MLGEICSLDWNVVGLTLRVVFMSLLFHCVLREIYYQSIKCFILDCFPVSAALLCLIHLSLFDTPL